MSAPDPLQWSPTKIRWITRCHDSGSEVVELVTDAGPAFAKFMGNSEGPHVLACELIGTHLAELLGLQTFEHAVFSYDGFPEITLHSGRRAEPGAAWAARTEEGIAWSGRAEDLRHVVNADDIAALVLLDLWTLNCDRFRPEPPPPRINLSNVFLSRLRAPEGRLRLLAIDHTHILSCGAPLRASIASIDNVRCATRFGVFPGFKGVLRWDAALQARSRMAAIPAEAIRQVVASVPRDWQVEPSIREAIVRFLLQRREWLNRAFPASIFDQPEFSLSP